MVLPRYQIREQEVDGIADLLIGKPFKSGARGPFHYDCFGLLVAMFLGCGIDLDDPFQKQTVDQGGFRRFRQLFRRVSPDEELQPLDVIKQRRLQAHVSIYLSHGFALDTSDHAFRSPVENLAPHITGIWRCKCLLAES